MSKEEFKEVIVLAIKDYLNGDKERIKHSLTVLDFVERILGEEEKGNPKVAIAAAALYDIGTKAVGEKAEGGRSIEEELDSISTARRLLDRSGAGKEVIEAVCSILEKRENFRSTDDLDSRIVHDARRLATLRGDSIASTTFLTPTGRRIAEESVSAK
jgi:HD superfamily phosphodiesterase